MKRFGTLDLCCGMGGLSFAARQAGLSIWAGVDVSQDALTSFKHNFPKAKIVCGSVAGNTAFSQYAEIVKAKRKSKQGLIVISGPPCQGFSVAGSRCASDPRNRILASVAKAIVKLKPEGALIENVPALKKDAYCNALNRFHGILKSAGYHVYDFELNALEFGAPQRRRRMIFFILPFKTEKHAIQQEIERYYQSAKTVKEILSDLPRPLVRPINYVPIKDNGGISNHYAMRHSKAVKAKIAKIKPGSGPLSYRKLDPDSHAATLLSGHRAPPTHYSQSRSITVREALRLQGFPDDFRVLGAFYSQMGQVTNAVPAQLGTAALKVLRKLLGENI